MYQLCEIKEEGPQTSEYINYKGVELDIEELPKGNLWALLIKQELQVSFLNDKTGREWVEII